MPLRQTDQFTQMPGMAERLLRRLFVEDWSLKLLALAITLILWFVVSGQDIEREITVQPNIDGKPAPSYELKGVTITPRQVRVRGSAASVNAKDIRALTEKISIEGRRESFDAMRTPVYTSDPSVEAIDTVNVHVDIGAALNQRK